MYMISIVSLLALCCIITSSSSDLPHGANTNNKSGKLKLHDGTYPGFHPLNRQPRSDAQPSHSEALLTQLLQHVTLLSAKTQALSSEVEDLKNHKDRLEVKVTTLESQVSTLSTELSHSTQTVLQQGTALQALLGQFSAWRTQQDANWLHHNQSLSVVTAEVSQLLSQFSDWKFKEETRWLEQNQSLSAVIADVSHLYTQSLESQLSQNMTQGQVDVQSLNISHLQGNVTSVAARTTDVEKRTTDLRAWKTNVTSDVRKISTTQENMRNDVNGITLQVSQAANTSMQLQSDVSRLTEKQASLALSVVFFAMRTETMNSRDRGPPSHAILFDKLPTNQGGAYNATSGVFTVPVDGDYSFAASSVSYSTSTSGQPHIQLMVDDDGMLMTSTLSPSMGAALRLRAGQRVWLRNVFSSRYGPGMYFAGFLVRPF